jgi:hypothetical protein
MVCFAISEVKVCKLESRQAPAKLLPSCLPACLRQRYADIDLNKRECNNLEGTSYYY